MSKLRLMIVGDTWDEVKKNVLKTAHEIENDSLPEKHQKEPEPEDYYNDGLRIAEAMRKARVEITTPHGTAGPLGTIASLASESSAPLSPTEQEFKSQTVNISDGIPKPYWRQQVAEQQDIVRASAEISTAPSDATYDWRQQAGNILRPSAEISTAPPVIAGPKFPIKPEAEQFHVDTSQRDRRGCPWSSQIHSTPPSLNRDGSWRSRRGVDKIVLAQIEAQLMGQGPAAPVVIPPMPAVTVASPVMPSAPQTQVPFTPAPVASVHPLNPPVHQQPVVQPQPVAQAYNPIPIPTGLKPAHTFATFKANFAPTIAGLLRDKKLTQEYVEQLKGYFGVAEIWDLTKDEAKLHEFFQALVAGDLITAVS